MFMKVTMAQRPWKYDSSVADIPWRDLTDDKRLVIGVMAEDPDYPLHPPVKRALSKAAAALEKAGHRIVHLPASPQRNAGHGARIGFQYFMMTGPDPDTISREVGEPLVASVARMVHPFSKGEFPVDQGMDVPDRLFALNEVKAEYGKAWMETWRDNELDVVLAPGAAHTAVPHDTYGNPVYTLMWNVLDVSFPDEDRDSMLTVTVPCWNYSIWHFVQV